jgi:hypothetical protein
MIGLQIVRIGFDREPELERAGELCSVHKRRSSFCRSSSLLKAFMTAGRCFLKKSAWLILLVGDVNVFLTIVFFGFGDNASDAFW